ncbi:MAG: hypothetical protein EOM67_07820 [Spirochaetia bacterium]|jgi:hypothetical protein|nr:hypothetical protein [Spirochaetia bacterium]
MRYIEAKKPVTKDSVIAYLVKHGDNPKDAKKKVDKNFDDVIQWKGYEDASTAEIADVISSLGTNKDSDQIRDSVQTFTVEGEVKIKQGDSVVILEAGDKIEVLRHLSETNITFALKQLVKDLMNAGFDYSEIGKELAKDVEWAAQTTGNPKMIVSGAIEYLNNYR